MALTALVEWYKLRVCGKELWRFGVLFLGCIFAGTSSFRKEERCWADSSCGKIELISVREVSNDCSSVCNSSIDISLMADRSRLESALVFTPPLLDCWD